MKIRFSKGQILIGVLVAMIVAVVMLQIQLMYSPRLSHNELTYEQIYNSIAPDYTAFAAALKPQLNTARIHSERVSIGTPDSQVIAAFLSKPEGNGPFPTYILLHDGGASTRAAEQLSISLGEELMDAENALVLSVDFRAAKNPLTESLDLTAILQWVQEYTEVERSQVYLAGIGRGSATAARWLMEGQNATAVAGLIAIEPYADPVKIWKQKKENDTASADLYAAEFSCAQSGQNVDLFTERCLSEFALASAESIETPTLLIRVPEAKTTSDEQFHAIKGLISEDSVTEKTIDGEDRESPVGQWRADSQAMGLLLKTLDEWHDAKEKATNTATTQSGAAPSTTHLPVIVE